MSITRKETVTTVIGKIYIGMIGQKGAGKTEFAKVFERRNPFYVNRISFSDPIVEMLRPIVPSYILNRKENWDKPISHLGNKTCRYLAQKLGTEFGRDMIDENVWMNLGEMKALEDTKIFQVFENVRFQNEYDMIRRHNGLIVCIESNHEEPDLSHVSEQLAKKFAASADITINNDLVNGKRKSRHEIFGPYIDQLTKGVID